MADPDISLANLAITVPSWDGCIMPHMVATLPAVKDVALQAAGISYAVIEFTVVAVAVKVYSLLIFNIVGAAGPLIDQREPVVVAADV